MKVRKLAVALALAGSMGSNLVYALGLGEAEVKSNLNEPLRAEINLVSPGDLTRDEIIASLAPERDFRKVGIEPIFFLNEIQFEVVKNNRGVMVLRLTTKRPVREPYLNFLVEVAWPSGRLLREYALLIDPPTFREGTAEAPAQAASAAPATSSQPAKSRAPQQARQASTPPRAEASQPASPSSYGPVSSTDTLWKIAREVRPSADLTPQQVMLALQDANPDAFLRNNINLVREGSVLRIPSEAEMRSRTPREAVQQVTAQNRSFQQPAESTQQAAIDGAGQRSGSTAAASAPAQAGDELRLLAGDAQAREDGSHGGDMGGSGSGDAESRLALSLEELDRSRRENDELSSRVEDLQEQLANMQRLVELKSDQLAELQARGDQAEGAPTSAEPQTPQEQGATGDDEALSDQEPSADETETAVADSGAEASGAEASGAEASGEEAEAGPFASDSASTNSQANGEASAEDVPEVAPQAPEVAPEETAQGKETPPPAADFTPRGILQQVMENPLYQVAVGATAIALLALLWLLARRSAKREENFYAQLQRDESGNVDGADAGLFAGGLAAAGAGGLDEDTAEHRDNQVSNADGDQDPLAEADVYIAYGRLDQAAKVLEDAISHEPSRSDLRLKLLEVYADGGDEDAFALQMSELEALDDETALLQAELLRERLAAQADAPSIDDLETQLRADVGRNESAEAAPDQVEEEDDLGISWSLDDNTEATDRSADDEFSSEYALDSSSAPEVEETDNDSQDIGFNLDDLELEDEASPEQKPTPADADDLTPEQIAGADSDNDLDFNFDEDELEDGLTEDVGDKGVELSDDELDSLDLGEELDLEEPSDETDKTAALSSGLAAAAIAQEAETEAEERATTAAPGSDAFDDSFLEELDAELEKVGESDSEAPDDLATEDAELDDLELDVTDEDLALIEEVAGGDSAEVNETGAVEEDELEGLLDISLDEDEDLVPEEVPTIDEKSLVVDEKAADADELPQLDDAEEETELEGDFDDSLLDISSSPTDDLDESDLGDDDDFDFLEGTDEAATKLDLARAYVEMGDAEGAREILEEVAVEGTDGQQQEAQDLLKKLA